MAAALGAAASTASCSSVRLNAASRGSAVQGRSSFVTGGCSQLSSGFSSLRGTGVACNSLNANLRKQPARSIVVSPRAVSDSQSVGEAMLDPDASRVSLSCMCP